MDPYESENEIPLAVLAQQLKKNGTEAFNGDLNEHYKIEIGARKRKEPEDYLVEGEGREPSSERKTKRTNKQKLAQKLKVSGKEYVSVGTKRVRPAKAIKTSCNTESSCKKLGRQCHKFTEADRQEIFEAYYKLCSLARQRDFIVRHVTTKPTKQKTTNAETSRRKKSHWYYFTLNGVRYSVCKKFFLNTLAISDRSVRTSLGKISTGGIMDIEKRGGRQSQKVIDRDKRLRETIQHHINRFPRVESHYCRASSTREYLHSELTVSKMYDLFVEENNNEDKPCIDLYRKVFRENNLSFHRPKKDQCSICSTYWKGDDEAKRKLKSKFEKHSAEKNKVREIKQKHKAKALEKDSKFVCASFDLQQVIYLPVSKESALFYKRRFANYNFTFYNIASKDCTCFMWHESISKRGASEISTCVYKALKDLDVNGAKFVSLFSDGCSGQNKNSIMAAMLLYTVRNSVNIEAISLHFFESFHGQNEGDSAHSTISSALAKSGDLFLPSQLHPIVRLARRSHPYDVHPLESKDFLNFKKLSKDIRILNVSVAESGEAIKWKEIMEFKVLKKQPMTVFFKTSHLEEQYQRLQLKRLPGNANQVHPETLNSELLKISLLKYRDLQSLCKGDNPVIKSNEFQQFYINLPHE